MAGRAFCAPLRTLLRRAAAATAGGATAAAAAATGAAGRRTLFHPALCEEAADADAAGETAIGEEEKVPFNPASRVRDNVIRAIGKIELPMTNSQWWMIRESGDKIPEAGCDLGELGQVVIRTNVKFKKGCEYDVHGMGDAEKRMWEPIVQFSIKAPDGEELPDEGQNVHWIQFARVDGSDYHFFGRLITSSREMSSRYLKHHGTPGSNWISGLNPEARMPAQKENSPTVECQLRWQPGEWYCDAPQMTVDRVSVFLDAHMPTNRSPYEVTVAQRPKDILRGVTKQKIRVSYRTYLLVGDQVKYELRWGFERLGSKEGGESRMLPFVGGPCNKMDIPEAWRTVSIQTQRGEVPTPRIADGVYQNSDQPALWPLGHGGQKHRGNMTKAGPRFRCVADASELVGLGSAEHCHIKGVNSQQWYLGLDGKHIWPALNGGRTKNYARDGASEDAKSLHPSMHLNMMDPEHYKWAPRWHPSQTGEEPSRRLGI